MTWCLKAIVMEQGEMAIAGQWYGKHAPVAMDTHAVIAELSDVMLPMKSVLWLDDENQLRVWVSG